MAGRSYGYPSYNSSPSPFSFGSNYISGPTYHHVSSGIYSPPSSTSRTFLPSSSSHLSSSSYSSSLSSSSFDLPRPKPFSGIRTGFQYHHMPTPTRIIKPNNFMLPSISESHVICSTRPTPPPLYRPFRPAPVTNRMEVRNTANIDVSTKPKSRLMEMAEMVSDLYKEADSCIYQGGIQRDFTVGTLKRGRKVIRLQTTRLPSDPSASVQPPPPQPEAKPEPPAAVHQPVIRTVEPVERPRPVLQPYNPPRPQKKTPGERMKEKFLLPSRKGVKKFPVQQPLRAVPPPLVPPTSQDSGLGSSPVVTAPTSFRDPKEEGSSSESIQEHLYGMQSSCKQPPISKNKILGGAGSSSGKFSFANSPNGSSLKAQT